MLGFTTLIALVGVASAQVYIPGFLNAQVSPKCARAVVGLIADPDVSACVPLSSIQSLAAGFNNHSIIGLFDALSESVCSSTPCSNATLAKIVTDIASGCDQEFGIVGEAPQVAESITSIIQAYYPTVRRLVCLTDGDAGCITQTLLNLGNFVGSLGVKATYEYIRNNGHGLEGLPNNIACTDCVKAIYNVLDNEQEWILGFLQIVFPSFPAQCGNDFTDGNIPSNIHVN